MLALAEESRAPRTIVLENVYGALTSHNGDDFNAIAKAFSGAGYRFGALIVDARLFVPQSRLRLFIIGVHPNVPIPEWLPGELMSSGILGLSSKRTRSYLRSLAQNGYGGARHSRRSGKVPSWT
jgi:DNA (cytosine-5)-methyltransferase 1